MMEGYHLWRAEGLVKPQAVESAVREYRSEMDIIAAFLDSEYIVQGGEVKASALYAVYCQWASECNEYKMPSRKFGREIGKKFNKRHTKNGVFYQGISVDNISIG